MVARIQTGRDEPLPLRIGHRSFGLTAPSRPFGFAIRKLSLFGF
nr:MAG TPA: hypothetical protein [Caudoviricetes sp.]